MGVVPELAPHTLLESLNFLPDDQVPNDVPLLERLMLLKPPFVQEYQKGLLNGV
jgi:hypothetical protein